ncbi:hypothetical protein HNS38_12710 [Lentimicrobium sp. L6]|uniref:hypothetical protein n=1 Tax=Lentimicrobium sp. L6 TaxID=2735916 RepID=UPI001553933B|nr:hypothetical protein [Lentimicrobium sp. L6]NPD85628.1 hypothetical protein [Lentimicrobium sp. L6]
MKNIFKTLAIGLIMVAAFLITSPVQADPPGMPGGHGTNGDAPPGGGAPIASGLTILVALSGAYAGKKVFTSQEEK